MRNIIKILTWIATMSTLSLAGQSTIALDQMKEAPRADMIILTGDGTTFPIVGIQKYRDLDTVHLQLTMDSLCFSLILDGPRSCVHRDSLGSGGGGSGTDDQNVVQFQLVGNEIRFELENDGQPVHTIDLSAYLDNTDNQTADNFSISGHEITLELEDDGEAPYTLIVPDTVRGPIPVTHVNDGAIDSITIDTTLIVLNDSIRDWQILSINEDTLFLTNGGWVILPDSFITRIDADSVDFALDPWHVVFANADGDPATSEAWASPMVLMNGTTRYIYLGQDNNIGLGENALSGSSASSVQNVAVGGSVLSNITTGDLNVGLGYESLQNITSGIGNTALGYRSGSSLTAPIYNSLFGYEAGSEIVDFDYNTYIGYRAGYDYQASFNVGIGQEALRNATGSGTDVAIGYQAGYAHSAAGNNIYIGRDAGRSNDSQIALAIGEDAMEFARGSSYNTAIGFHAGRYYNGTTSMLIGSGAGAGTTGLTGLGYSNVAIGHESMHFIDGADFGTAIGYRTLYRTTTGGRNVGIGYEASFNGTTHGHNVAIGYRALKGNVTAQYNVAIGTVAGSAATDPDSDTYVGSYSGYLQYGDFNTAIGASAFRNGYGTGDQNVAIGFQALYQPSGESDFNTLVGTRSGYTTDDSDELTGVGYNSLYSNVDGNGSTALGAYAGEDAVSSSMSMYLGYGAGEGNTADTSIVIIDPDGLNGGEWLMWGDAGEDSVKIHDKLFVPYRIYGGSNYITGERLDSDGDAGTSGQVMTSTVTGTNWADASGGGADSIKLTPYRVTWTDADSNLVTDGTASNILFEESGTRIFEAFTAKDSLVVDDVIRATRRLESGAVVTTYMAGANHIAATILSAHSLGDYGGSQGFYTIPIPAEVGWDGSLISIDFSIAALGDTFSVAGSVSGELDASETWVNPGYRINQNSCSVDSIVFTEMQTSGRAAILLYTTYNTGSTDAIFSIGRIEVRNNSGINVDAWANGVWGTANSPVSPGQVRYEPPQCDTTTTTSGTSADLEDRGVVFWNESINNFDTDSTKLSWDGQALRINTEETSTGFPAPYDLVVNHSVNLITDDDILEPTEIRFESIEGGNEWYWDMRATDASFHIHHEDHTGDVPTFGVFSTGQLDMNYYGDDIFPYTSGGAFSDLRVLLANGSGSVWEAPIDSLWNSSGGGSTAWGDITGIPSDIADGDDDTNYWTLSGLNLWSSSSYNVGIGTGSPTHKFQVNGDSRFAGLIEPDHIEDINASTGVANQILTVRAAGGGFIAWQTLDFDYSSTTGLFDLKVGSSIVETLNIGGQWSTDASSMWTSKNIGINDGTPSYDLEVNGTLQADDASFPVVRDLGGDSGLPNQVFTVRAAGTYTNWQSLGLSLSGSTLNLIVGSTVVDSQVLPGGSDGDGIYDGSGSLSGSTTVSLSTNALYFDYNGGTDEFALSSSGLFLRHSSGVFLGDLDYASDELQITGDANGPRLHHEAYDDDYIRLESNKHHFVINGVSEAQIIDGIAIFANNDFRIASSSGNPRIGRQDATAEYIWFTGGGEMRWYSTGQDRAIFSDDGWLDLDVGFTGDNFINSTSSSEGMKLTSSETQFFTGGALRGRFNSSGYFYTETGGRIGVGMNPTNAAALQVNGTASKNAAGAFVLHSDKRLKNDITQLNGASELKRLLNLRGVTYEWNELSKGFGFDRAAGKQYGLIAQDIQKSYDHQFVNEDEVTGYLQASYDLYDPIYIEIIRHLNDRITELEKLINK